MSQMIPFQQAALPAHLQQAAGGAQDNLIAASGTGGGQQVDHISIKGGRFHIVRNGQQPVTLQLFALQVIILHANPGVTKAFFEGAWNPDAEAEAPICSSDDGVVPRADADKPQCNTCAACPQNQFGSKINPQTGKQGKACMDKKTVAVVTPGEVDGEVLRLQIPADSMKEFGPYLRNLPVKYCYVVTEISFDTSVSYPRLKFKPIGYVSEQDAAAITRRHDTPEVKAIAGISGATPMRSPAPQQAALAAPPAHLQQIPVQQIPVQQQPVQQQVQQVQQVYQQPVQQAPVQQQFAQQPVQQQVQQAPAQQQFAQPRVAAAPQPADPGVAAIFGGQAGNVQQPAAGVAQPMQAAQNTAQINRHPSGREYGKPAAGKQRRTKAEMAEDAAMGIGRAAGESAEDDAPQQQVQQAPVQQAPVQQPQFVQQQPVYEQQVQQAAQVVQDGFGQPVAQAQQPIEQPANQPQVMTGGAVDAFAGWDD